MLGKEEDNNDGLFVFNPRGIENHSEAQEMDKMWRKTTMMKTM